MPDELEDHREAQEDLREESDELREEQAEILVKVGVYMYDLGPDGAGPQSVVRRRVLSQRITPTSDRVRVLRQVHKAAACRNSRVLR